ncbi:hypothetical protein Vretimale_6755, partial [Volvox reticuliferus]
SPSPPSKPPNPNSPPSPKPRPSIPLAIGFPFCDCASYSGSSFPWRVAVANVTSVRVNNIMADRVCVRMYVDPVAAAACNNALGSCCGEGLQKFEFVANGRCKGSILPFTLSTSTEIKSSFMWDSTHPVLKFSRLDIPYADGLAGGASLCFSFKGPSCTKFSELCPGRGCQTAVFSTVSANSPNTCCPKNLVLGF